MTPGVAVQLVLKEARRYLGHQEQPPGSNRSRLIDYWLAETGVDVGLPWCAAWVHQVGRQALGARWPVPRTASVAAIHTWAERSSMLVVAPHVGDLFLVWNAGLKRYAHVGFVEELTAAGAVSSAKTLEGNTNPGGSREGFGVFRRERRIAPPLVYVRWSAALEAAA